MYPGTLSFIASAGGTGAGVGFVPASSGGSSWWVDGYAGLGREYAAAHRPDVAEAVYRDIVARLAVVAAAYPPLAEFYAQAGQGDRLIALYEGAVAAAPTQSWPYVSLATAYQNNHQPALALAALQEAIAPRPWQYQALPPTG